MNENENTLNGNVKERNIVSAQPRNRPLDSNSNSKGDEIIPVSNTKKRPVQTSQSSRLNTLG